MNNTATTGLKGNVRRVILAAVVGLFVWTSGATAQETLADAVQQSGCNWLIGKWAGEAPDGQKYQIEYKWALKNHVISIHFKGFDFEYHGIIFFDADKEEVVQIGVDSNGGNGKGTWFAEYGTATMRNEQKGEYGEISRMGFVYARVDDRTMKTEVYEMDSNGQLGAQPSGTLEYKRQETAAGTATKTQR